MIKPSLFKAFFLYFFKHETILLDNMQTAKHTLTLLRTIKMIKVQWELEHISVIQPVRPPESTLVVLILAYLNPLNDSQICPTTFSTYLKP